MHKIYLSLGANLGDRLAHIQLAVSLLEETVGQLIEISPFYETEAWGFQSENSFINCCLSMKTRLGPQLLLEATQVIEKEIGRVKKGGAYADRMIDIDILFYGDEQVNLPALQIPHPRISERNFILRPLADIAPTLLHPGMDLSISQLLEVCSDKAQVRQIEEL